MQQLGLHRSAVKLEMEDRRTNANLAWNGIYGVYATLVADPSSQINPVKESRGVTCHDCP
jgi:hypothetical protein